MKKCTQCGGTMQACTSKTPEGATYEYYKCDHCGEEILDMQQLHAVAEQYRTMKNYHVKLSKWGLSLGMRIPKEVVKKYKFRENEEVIIIPEEQGIKIVPT